MRKYLVAICLILCFEAHTQIFAPVKWSYSTKEVSKNTYDLILKANIEKGWHVFSQHLSDSGFFPTEFKFRKNRAYSLVGNVKEISNAIRVHDAGFDMDVTYFKEEAIFVQRIKLEKPFSRIKGSLEYQTCGDSMCLPPEIVDFNFKLPK